MRGGLVTLCSNTAGKGGPRSFLIIGGGFSGAATAAHLALRATGPTRITLIESGERVARGVAYGIRNEHWLLNVPAGRLSIDPARPGDLHQWALETGRVSAPDAFLPRAWFGEYAEARLEQAVASRGGLVELVRVRDRVEGLTIDSAGLRVKTGDGRSITGEHAVLALGNGPIRVPRAFVGLGDDERVLRSPWDEAGLAALASTARRILLVGTGLTMFDTAIGLERLGFRGDLVTVSRRGLLARPHGPKDDAAHARWASGLRGLDLRRLVRAVRQRAEQGDWRGVVDSLRPHTAALWAGLSERDRARFLSRAAVYWDVHRHRAPSQVHAEVAALLATGRMRLVTGAVDSAHRAGERIAVRLRPRHAGETTVYADGVVLCTGPDPDPRRWGSALVDGLLADGLAVTDPLGLGLRSDAAGRLIGADGAPSDRLSTIGPLRRGDLWESTAVPEISAQAAALGAALLGSDAGINRTGPAPMSPAPAGAGRHSSGR